MSYLNVRSQLFGVPLLVTPRYADIVVSALSDRLEVEPKVSQAALDAQTLDVQRRQATGVTLDEATGVAVLSVVGGMVHRGGFMEAYSGVQSYTSIQNILGGLLSDRKVKGVLLDLDTPGGQVAGLQELVTFIQTASKAAGKPVWALANTMACSAGYWMAAAADRLLVAPAAAVGSVGVIVMHADVSKAMEKRGVVTTMIFAGKHKADGNPYEPLPASVRDAVKASVDSLYDEFTSSVARMRAPALDVDKVRKTEAGILDPDTAVEYGFADDKSSFGDAKAELAEFVSPRSYIRSLMNGENNMAMFSQADVDNARAEGKAEGARTSAFDHTTALAEARAAGSAEGEKRAGGLIMAAVNALVPGNARLETFGDMLADGSSIATAQKAAGRLPGDAPAASTETTTQAQGQGAPAGGAAAGGNGNTRTAADVDRHMQGHTPSVASGDEQKMTEREARMAQIKRAGAEYGRNKGYAVRQ